MKTLALLAGCLLALGCVEVQPAAQLCVDPTGAADAGAGITWHQDIAPIFAARCMRCHEGNGPGPMRLTTFAQVLGAKDAARLAIEARRMPPWPPAACCAEYKNTAALSADERAKVLTWFQTGTAEGAEAPAPPILARGGLSRVDLTLTMKDPYLPAPPAGSNDETRCFLIDWPATQTQYVTGVDILPGVRAQMHHALVLTAAPSDVKRLQELDTAAPGPGWPCPGGLLGSFKDVLGGSFYEAEQYEDGLGHEVKPGEKLVLTMHYSAPPAGDFLEDQTSVLLRTQTEPTRRMTALSVFNPAWLLKGMGIAANAANVTYSYADEPTRWAGGRPFNLHVVNLHMHERGTKGQVAILRKDGTRECLLQIDRWDHHWQGDFSFATTKRISAGDRLLVSCTFDNTEGNQKVVRGVREKPRDLNWAEEEEMCVAFVTASQD